MTKQWTPNFKKELPLEKEVQREIRGSDYLTLTKELRINAGNQSFNASDQGQWMGSGQFATAPFSVDMAGNLIANSAEINGASLLNAPDFGDGSDGIIDINANAFSGGSISGGTMQRDLFFSQITLSGGDLNNGGYRLFSSGTLQINAGYKIHRNGYAGGNGQTGGVALGGSGGSALVSGTLYGAVKGSTGGTGGNDANGNPGSNGENISNSLISSDGATGGAGGNAGANTGGNGGSRGTPTPASSRSRSNIFGLFYDITDGAYPARLKGSAGSSGGGGGADAGGVPSSIGGGGGGSGSPGGIVWIAAKNIVLNGNIEAFGGSGGNGGNASSDGPATGGGGGGAGANGGVVVLIYNKLTVGTGTIYVSGGTAGVGGTGLNGGLSGSNGEAGSAGILMQLPR